ncbi:MAG: helix-turn-helix domain-containing protein [Eubacteriales bacterium]|nr:helix-turn-helix domain-containing protein [Eubacteriales bacterium]
MDHSKIGKLIYALRKNANLTQKQLADSLNISDKAISKWERGMGFPDVSLLSSLADVFGVGIDCLLSGELNENETSGGNMRNTKFYICPKCGNLLTGTDKVVVTCCGMKLPLSVPIKASDDDLLSVEIIEGEYFISTDHEMNKEHYISFIALLTGDSIIIRRQYPEWNIQIRIPLFGHGKLIWHCVKHGLFYQTI